MVCKFIVAIANARRVTAMLPGSSRNIRAMRSISKQPDNGVSAAFGDFFSLRALALALAVSAFVIPGLSIATNTDSIDPASLVAPPTPQPSVLERVEKNLREVGERAKNAASEISKTALGLIGVDYKFGGNSPDTGLDCSGFVRYVFQHATGISLPRSAREQAKVGKVVNKNQLEPGDLVFFNTRRFQFSHVGVYLGDNRFIHAPSRGGSVEVVRLDNAYWQKTFNGARRVIGAVAGGEANAATLREFAKIEAELKAQRETPPTVTPPAPAKSNAQPGEDQSLFTRN